SDKPKEKLYTSPEDMLAVYEALNGLGRYMFAATFGNVHGSYKPGAVKLRPDILKRGQEAVMAKYGKSAEFDLVFHGGAGTPPGKRSSGSRSSLRESSERVARSKFKNGGRSGFCVNERCCPAIFEF